MIKKIFFSLVLLLGISSAAFACDEASITLNSSTDNMDGTYTYEFNFCVEFLGLEGNPSWFSMNFSGGTFTTVSTYSPTTITSGTNDDYNGVLQGGNTGIRWTTPEIFPSHTGTTLCTTVTVTTNGAAGTVSGSFHDTYGGSCNYTLALPLPCSITNLSAGTQTACNPVDNTYTQQVTVTYENPPASGNLVVNGQSFPIGTSPQTVTLTGLISNGSPVNVTANFSAEVTCSMTTAGLFTAPTSCTTSCNISNLSAGTQTACDPADNTYTQQITITYTNPPASGTLLVNGQSFAIGTSPQIVTLVGLSADGNAVDVTASFSADAACMLTDLGLFTAPTACSDPCAARAFLR